MTNTIATLLLVAHVIFHLGGSLGVILGLIHWNRVHGVSIWKGLAALFWTLISIVALVSSLMENHSC